MWVVRLSGLVLCTVFAASVTIATDQKVETTECSTDKHFRCDNGKCISNTLVCDGNNNCDKRRRGTICEAFPCAVVKLKDCANGSCVTHLDLCGGKVQCTNSTDENITMCMSRECDSTVLFKCDVGRCIKRELLCDGIIDCTDGADENKQYCESRTCYPLQLKCDNGRCLDNEFICDGVSHCTDGSDEFEDLCQRKQCPPNETTKYQNSKCVPNSEDFINGLEPGPWNTDHSRVCQKSTHFRCNDGKCIGNELLCNANYDCHDHEDEKECIRPSKLCPNKRYKCRDGNCVTNKKYCFDYGFRDDEQQPDGPIYTDNQWCPMRCENGKCVAHYGLCNDDNDQYERGASSGGLWPGRWDDRTPYYNGQYERGASSGGLRPGQWDDRTPYYNGQYERGASSGGLRPGRWDDRTPY